MDANGTFAIGVPDRVPSRMSTDRAVDWYFHACCQARVSKYKYIGPSRLGQPFWPGQRFLMHASRGMSLQVAYKHCQITILLQGKIEE